MSYFFRRTSTLAVLSAGTMLSACQDSTAPAYDATVEATHITPAMSRSTASGRVIKDQYIVVLRDGVNDIEPTSKKLVGKTRGKLNRVYKGALRGFAANMSAAEAAALSLDPRVAYVEQDQLVTLGVGKPTSGGSGSKGGGKSTGGKGKPGTPVDTGVVTQYQPPSWGLDRIDQLDLPLSNSYEYQSRGTGVHAYIVDSGIRTSHVEFGGRATADFSVIDDGNGALDCNWHGTHVAGIVGGQTTGVAKGVALHSVRVLDCAGTGTVSGLIAGLDWIAQNRQLPA